MLSLILALYLCEVQSSALYTLISTNPSCDLWLYTRGLQKDSSGVPVAWLGQERKLFAANISSDGNFQEKLWFTQLIAGAVDSNLRNTGENGIQPSFAEVQVMWVNTPYAMHVDMKHIMKREKLLLLQDFELMLLGQRSKVWVELRQGDDFEAIVKAFVALNAPLANAEEYVFLRNKILSSYEANMAKLPRVLEDMEVAAKEAVALHGTLNVIVGDVTEKISTGKDGSIWIHYSINTLDLTNSNFMNIIHKLLPGAGIDTIVSEHTWEHFTIAEAILAAKYCFDALAPGGLLRIAVPDVNSALAHAGSSKMLDEEGRVRHLSAAGVLRKDIKDGHLIHWSPCSLKEVLTVAGFLPAHIEAVEYTMPNGTVYSNDWLYEDGPIERSSKGSKRLASSLVVDARKPLLVENNRSDIVSVAIDCTDMSLSSSQYEVWLHLIRLLPIHLKKVVRSNFKIIVVLEKVRANEANAMEWEAKNRNLIEVVEKQTNMDVFTLFTEGGSAVWPGNMLRKLAVTGITHIISSGKYSQSIQKWVASRNLETTIRIISIYSTLYEGMNNSAECIIPYINSFTSADKSSTPCLNTRYGVERDEFGHNDVQQNKVAKLREVIANSSSNTNSSWYHMVLNNPYIIMAMSPTRCRALETYRYQPFSGSSGVDSNDKYGKMFWSVIDGISEGMVGLPLDYRPWLLFLGNCNWTNFTYYRKLESVTWVSINRTERISAETSRIALSGAMTFINLPEIVRADYSRDNTLNLNQLFSLRSLAAGCPVISWKPHDLVTMFEDTENLDLVSSVRTYYNENVMLLEDIKPMSIWSALRIFISKYRLETKNILEMRRLDTISRTRQKFIGWNAFTSAVFFK